MCNTGLTWIFCWRSSRVIQGQDRRQRERYMKHINPFTTDPIKALYFATLV